MDTIRYIIVRGNQKNKSMIIREIWEKHNMGECREMINKVSSSIRQ